MPPKTVASSDELCVTRLSRTHTELVRRRHHVVPGEKGDGPTNQDRCPGHQQNGIRALGMLGGDLFHICQGKDGWRMALAATHAVAYHRWMTQVDVPLLLSREPNGLRGELRIGEGLRGRGRLHLPTGARPNVGHENEQRRCAKGGMTQWLLQSRVTRSRERALPPCYQVRATGEASGSGHFFTALDGWHPSCRPGHVIGR